MDISAFENSIGLFRLGEYGASIVAGSIVLAFATQKLFDGPVRKWLTMKAKTRK
ncbi:MAG TPA: hypothetical protein PK191_07655 [Niabella sp.]|nr:hypothetical protein [Niabella sp.]HOZ97631.1 hypothetical protein [Niabella sp.]HQW15769.1 hypothetical protein [Niabella sp.]HQX21044.1 hypothetical protein [Niabella sp.]HQX42363.1 hypothetical protein [Niabella sp.]